MRATQARIGELLQPLWALGIASVVLWYRSTYEICALQGFWGVRAGFVGSPHFKIPWSSVYDFRCYGHSRLMFCGRMALAALGSNRRSFDANGASSAICGLCGSVALVSRDVLCVAMRYAGQRTLVCWEIVVVALHVWTVDLWRLFARSF